MVLEPRDSLGGSGWQLNATNWPLVLLSGAFLFTRLFLKVVQRRELWWDDHVLVLSWATLTAQSGVWSAMINLGFGNDPSQIDPQNGPRLLLLLNVASTLLILANLWGKTSFAITLLRLPLGWTRNIVMFLLISMTIILPVSAVFVWTQCYTPDQTVDAISGLRCLPNSVVVYYSVFSGAYSAVVDFTLAVVPLKFLWNLQIKKSEKIGVILAMSMGIFAGITAIIKTTIFPHLQLNIAAGLQVAEWGAVESAVSIMAACIPILRALVRQGSYPGQLGPETAEYGGATAFHGRSALAATRASSRPINSFRQPSLPGDDPTDPHGLAAKTGRGAKDSSRRDPEVGKLDDDEWDGLDKMSFEMTSYGIRTRPTDFTRDY